MSETLKKIEKIKAGTYVQISDISSSDFLYSKKDYLKKSIFIVGAVEDKFDRDHLLLNEQNVGRFVSGYYSGPVTDINTGVSYFLGSIQVKTLDVEKPTTSTIVGGTPILLLDVPFVERLNGKLVNVGSGGLKQTPNLGNDTYSGFINVYDEQGSISETLNLSGLKFLLVKDKNQTQDSIVSTTETKVDAKKPDNTNKEAKKDENVMRIENPTEKYTITSMRDNVYHEVARISGNFDFGDQAISDSANIENWGDWHPTDGLTGTLIWKGNNSKLGHDLYVLKLDIKDPNGNNRIVVMNPAGLTKVEQPKVVEQPKANPEDAKNAELKKQVESQSVQVQDNLKILKELEDKKRAEDAAKKAKEAAESAARTKDPDASAAKAGSDTPKPVSPASESGKQDNSTIAKAAVASAAINSGVQNTSKNPEVSGQGKKEGIIMSTWNSAVTTAKSDAKKVGVRTAKKQVRKVLTKPLFAYLKARFPNSQDLEKFLESKEAQAVIDILLGIGLANIPIPNAKYAGIAAEVAEEFRVDGGTEIADTLADLFTEPLLQIAEIYAGVLGTPAEDEGPKPAASMEDLSARRTQVPVTVEVEETVGAGSRSGR